MQPSIVLREDQLARSWETLWQGSELVLLWQLLRLTSSMAQHYHTFTE